MEVLNEINFNIERSIFLFCKADNSREKHKHSYGVIVQKVHITMH